MARCISDFYQTAFVSLQSISMLGIGWREPLLTNTYMLYWAGHDAVRQTSKYTGHDKLTATQILSSYSTFSL